VRKAIVNESRDEFVDDAVVRLTPFFARRDQLEMSKERELMTHRRHRKSERMRQVADAELFVRESVHQSQPKRIRQSEKDFDSFGGGFFGRK
jgi:hypothetical protein